jgi:hypothetical protein
MDTGRASTPVDVPFSASRWEPRDVKQDPLRVSTGKPSAYAKG